MSPKDIGFYTHRGYKWRIRTYLHPNVFLGLCDELNMTVSSDTRTGLNESIQEAVDMTLEELAKRKAGK